MKIFKDSNGRDIQAGDILYREVFARWRERPGHKRVAINGMSGQEAVVRDEGNLLNATPQWITRKVRWSGACLIAERHEYSDFQAILGATLFDRDGKQVSESSAFDYMNSVFKGEVYTIINRR